MLRRFTYDARQVVLRAVQHARLRGQAVEPGHLLLSVAETADLADVGPPRELGITAEAVASHLPPPLAEPPQQDPPFSPEARRVLEAAAQSARHLGHRHIGPEHLLMALADENAAGQAASILKAIGVDPAALRARLAEHRPLRPYRFGGSHGWLGHLWAQPHSAAPRDWVVSVRLDEPTLMAVDGLVRAGVANSRSQAVFLLCRKGIEAHRQLFDRLAEKMASVAEIEQEMRRIFSAEGETSPS